MTPAALWYTVGAAFALQEASGGQRLDAQLRIEWKRKTIEAAKKVTALPDGSTVEEEYPVLRFSEGVVARFGVTTATAPEVVAHVTSDDPWFLASGGVKITDPEGTFTAENLLIHWRTGKGRASGLVLSMGGLSVRADSAELEADRWKLAGVRVSACERLGDAFAFTLKEADVAPGDRARLRRVGLNLMGLRFSIPRTTASLGGEPSGFRLPRVSIRAGREPSLKWDSDWELGPLTELSASLAAAADREAAGSLYLTRLISNPGPEPRVSAPRSELNQPFGDGYFENVTVNSPSAETKSLADSRTTLSVGGTLNRRVRTPTDVERATKPWEIVWESVGSPSGVGVRAQWRTHRIGEDGEREVTRHVAVVSVVPTPVKLADRVYGVARLDARYFANPDSSFAWSRLSAGALWECSDQVRLGAIAAMGSETGRPQFDFDRAAPYDAAHFRADFRLRGFEFRALFKVRQSDWRTFDSEYFLKLQTGCFMPFVAYRNSPQRLTFGIELTSLESLNRLPGRLKARGASNEAPAQSSVPWPR